MCEYCKNDGYYKANKSLISKKLRNNVYVDIQVNVKDKKLIASIENLKNKTYDDNWIIATRKINYCPICRTKTSRRWTKIGRKGGQAMTKEQEEAIEYVQEQIDYYKEQIKFIEAVDSDYYDEEYELYKNRVKQFETVLSMLKEKDKIIDLITQFLGEQDLGYYKNESGGEILGIMRKYNKEDWKEYFEDKLNSSEQN